MQSLRNFIRITPEASSYQCSFCFQVDLKLAQLACPCQKYICLTCIRLLSYCHFCNLNLQVQQPKTIQLEFYCLSNSPQCELIFPSKEALLKHCVEDCPYIDKDARQELKHAVEFQCKYGHRLQIANTFSSCTICHSGNMCKSRCETCLRKVQSMSVPSKDHQSGYCIHCRPIPCTKMICPHGHNLVKIIGRAATCDLCGNSVRRFHSPTYTDQACDFDICSVCYNDLPQQHHLLPIELPQLEPN